MCCHGPAARNPPLHKGHAWRRLGVDQQQPADRSSNWFQGNPAVFPAHAGATDAYIAAIFNNAVGSGGDISNWLILPALALKNGDSVSFYTRTPQGSSWPDGREVRLNPSNITNVGGYPEAWTQSRATVSGLAVPTLSRLALRYFVTDSATNSNFIGVDTLTVDVIRAGQVPERLRPCC